MNDERTIEQPIQDYVRFDRVRERTASHVNDRIDLLTQAQLLRVREQGHDAIQRRLVELDREWDIDRALMLNFAIIGSATFAAGISGRKGWLYFFGVQLFFLGLHATQGWCPPASVFRRMSFRTRNEIEAEKHALLLSLQSRGRSQSRAAQGLKAG